MMTSKAPNLPLLSLCLRPSLFIGALYEAIMNDRMKIGGDLYLADLLWVRPRWWLFLAARVDHEPSCSGEQGKRERMVR